MSSLYAAYGRVYLQLGNLSLADNCFSQAAKTRDSSAAGQLEAVLDSAFLAVGQGHFQVISYWLFNMIFCQCHHNIVSKLYFAYISYMVNNLLGGFGKIFSGWAAGLFIRRCQSCQDDQQQHRCLSPLRWKTQGWAPEIRKGCYTGSKQYSGSVHSLSLKVHHILNVPSQYVSCSKTMIIDKWSYPHKYTYLKLKMQVFLTHKNVFHFFYNPLF